jgi:hypothetical protein
MRIRHSNQARHAVHPRQDVMPSAITSAPTAIPTQLALETNSVSMTDAWNRPTTNSPPQPTQTSDSSSGGSGGGLSTIATAGIAIGVIGGIGVFALFVYLIISRRRKQAREENKQVVKEKSPPSTATSAALPAPPSLAAKFDHPSAASQLSLTLNPAASAPSRAGNRMVDKPLPSPAYSSIAPSRNQDESNDWLSPLNNRNSTYSNPFDNEMATVSSLKSDDRSVFTRNRSPSPISMNEVFPSRPVTRFMPEIVVAPAPAPMSGQVTSLTRKTSLRNQNPANMQPGIAITTPGNSPFGNEYAFTNGATRDATSPAPKEGPVHRVQLDFKPTLEDEMELKAGELVHVAHEFDDGWVLCVRQEGPGEGIVPRTCLSSNPVRPRH